jgi:hypothetical protein
MNPIQNRVAAKALFFGVATLGVLFPANAADVQWHVVTDHLPVTKFTLSPVGPTTTNIISFVAPTDGDFYANSCFASVANGEPAMAVDAVFLTVKVTFSAPLTNIACPLVVLPVSGVDGQFGPLRAGNWAFTILTNSYFFSVAEAPLSLSIKALTNSSLLQVSWPVSGEPFAVEFSDSLSSINWQTVTNTPIVSNGQNILEIGRGPGSRFYRLLRLAL